LNHRIIESLSASQDMTRSKKPTTPQNDLLEGKDYYLEGSSMVFTADFLRRRGYCCESGCRHCPYGFGPEGLKRKLAAEKIAGEEP